MIKILNKLKNINNNIDVQLKNFYNTMENYLKYSRFYLKSNENIDYYNENISIFNYEIEEIIKDFLEIQIEKIQNIFDLLINYKSNYHKNIKQEINNTINNVITELIDNYIANKIDKGEKIFISSNKTNLENINFILGSSRLNFSFNIKNTVLEWGYNLTKDSNNYKLYLDIYSGGYSESSISYANEFYNTSIQGKLGNILIGMNIENDYSKDSVLIDYYIKYNNNSYIKYLYDITIFDSWKFCENEADCFLTKMMIIVLILLKLKMNIKLLLSLN